MDNNKMKAVPTFDEELDKWIILVTIDDETMPIGTIVNKDLNLFEYTKFDSEELAKKWLDEHSDKFYYHIESGKVGKLS